MTIVVVLLVLLAASAAAFFFAINALVNVIRFRVPYVTTPDWAIRWLCKNLKLTNEQVVDLGCGDARVLIALKQHFPNITATGYEQQWWPYVIARWRTRNTGVAVRKENFYKTNLGDATIVFFFLIDSVMPRVEQLLKKQLKRGARVYSYGFRFPTWQPEEQIVNPKRPNGSKINVYLR